MSGAGEEVWWISFIKAAIVINILMGAFAYTTWLERKALGRMQLRYGPNRAGPFGLLIPIADLIKLVRKESFVPRYGVEGLYLLAPLVAAFTALVTFAVIPWGPVWTIGDYQVTGWVADVSIALILIFAIGSLGIYGFIVGGWASESKYSLLGSMRTCAQMVSYEVSLALSVLGVVIMGESLSLADARALGVRTGDPVSVGSNGAGRALSARVNRRLLAGVVRIADDHAGGLGEVVDVRGAGS